MPGDELIAEPTFNATRAVTVHAAPEQIYPWLVQIGITRAGWYSYDWVDNPGRPSARRVIPELQKMKVGDIVMRRKCMLAIKERAEAPAEAA